MTRKFSLTYNHMIDPTYAYAILLTVIFTDFFHFDRRIGFSPKDNKPWNY